MDRTARGGINKKVFVIILLFFALWVGGCNTKKLSGEMIQTNSKEIMQSEVLLNKSVEEKLDDSIKAYVTWAVPKGIQISKETENEINRMLQANGEDFYFKLVEIDGDYVKGLDSSNVDIAFIGFNYLDAMLPTREIENGKYLCLDELLKGSNLYDCIPEVLWKAVEYKQSIYYIPNEVLQNVGNCILFDETRNNLKNTETFEGDIFDLESYTSNGSLIFYGLDGFRFAECFGYIYDNGLLARQDGSLVYPFEDESCMKWLQTLRSWYQKEILVVDVNKKNDCGIQMVSDYGDEKEGQRKYAWKGSVCQRKNLSIGIRSNSTNVERAFRFLELIHMNSDYGNLLVFEKENLSEGNMNYANWTRQLVFGLDTGLQKGSEGLRHFESADEKRDYYTKETVNSPFLGTELPSECVDLVNLIDQYLSVEMIFREENFEDRLEQFQEEYTVLWKIITEKMMENGNGIEN